MIKIEKVERICVCIRCKGTGKVTSACSDCKGWGYLLENVEKGKSAK